MATAGAAGGGGAAAAGAQKTAVETLRHGQKKLTVEVIVLRRPSLDAQLGRAQSASNFLVADATAAINLCVFPEHHPQLIAEGDILRITAGYASLYRGSLTLYVGQHGRLVRTGRFTMVFQEVPNMSELKFEIDTARGAPPVVREAP